MLSILGSALFARRRRLREAQRGNRPEHSQISGPSDYESERVGSTRRKRKKRPCKHDPQAHALAETIMGAYWWITESTEIDPNLTNGLEGTSWSLICKTETSLFLALILYRMMNYATVQTFYVPDEYWQSLEVAHKHVFSDGYLTWEWREKIRGYTYPAVFSILYKLLYYIGADSPNLIIRLPRLAQSLFSAVGDLYLYKLSSKLAGPQVAQWTIICNSLCWFIFYCATRTLSNTAEMTLITIGLYHYPWTKSLVKEKSWFKYLWFAALSVIIRPTAVIVWIPLAIAHLSSCGGKLKSSLLIYVFTGIFFLCISMRIDKSIYGEWSLVPYNFFTLNIGKKISHFYGTHPWYWYITDCLPFCLTTHLIPLLCGWKLCKNRLLQTVIVFTLLVYSMLAHKEFRFILPILPLMMHVCGYYITTVHQYKLKPVDSSEPILEDLDEEGIAAFVDKVKIDMQTERDSGLTSGSEHSDQISDSEIISAVKSKLSHKKQPPKQYLTVKLIVILMIIANIPMMVYFCMLHQRGNLDVMKYLTAEVDKHASGNMSVLFLMPCHSTPYYSHVHSNITMRFLTCEPNLNNVTNYRDEADMFYKAPKKWLKREIVQAKDKIIYTHVVFYEDLVDQIKPFLDKFKYHLSNKFFFSHLLFDERQSKHIVVYQKPIAT